MARTSFSSGSPWEGHVGYARAVRVASLIEVSGTVAADAQGNALYEKDAGRQAEQVFSRIVAAVEALGGKKEDIVRTRTYLVEMADWEAVGAAHQKFFGDLRPAATMLQVAALIGRGFRVEIEATAYLP